MSYIPTLPVYTDNAIVGYTNTYESITISGGALTPSLTTSALKLLTGVTATFSIEEPTGSSGACIVVFNVDSGDLPITLTLGTGVYTTTALDLVAGYNSIKFLKFGTNKTIVQLNEGTPVI